jgi:hypothetical protein
VYVEGAVEEYRVGGEALQGTAAYATTDIDLQVVSLLLEGLWLDQFQVYGSKNQTLKQDTIYNQAPTLERIDQEVLNTRDVRGGRAKISRPFFDGDLVLYVSGMLRQYGSTREEIAGLTPTVHNAVHGYGGFELTYGPGMSRWYASGGYRDEKDDGATESFKTMAHAETDWVHALGAGYALHLTVSHEERTQEQREYRRGTTLVGFDRFGLGSLMAEVGYDTQNPQTRQLYLAGIIAWEFDRWLTMRAVLGSQRGGIKCIGGVCRDFPAFAGARFPATVQHARL